MQRRTSLGVKRRQLVLATPLVVVAPALLVGCSGDLKGFANFDEARKVITSITPRWRTKGAWPMPDVLNHLAQSIEYSMVGFPRAKPAWFRHSLGLAGFALFNARGQMSHALDEPIPGAPPTSGTLAVAKARLLAAMAEFEAHKGELKNHFAYGSLSREQYTRAHLMHLHNHWAEVVPS